jgi:hypothetical protein
MNLLYSVAITFIAAFLIQYFIISFIMTDSIKNMKNSTGKIYISLISALLISTVKVGIHDVSNFTISTKYYGLLVSLLIISIFLYKKQFFVNDKNYLEAMIENDSMSLLTSNSIINKTKNDNIKKLAENIVKTKTKEIEAMNAIIKEIMPVKKDEPKKDEDTKQNIEQPKKDTVKEELKNVNNEKLKNIIN